MSRGSKFKWLTHLTSISNFKSIQATYNLLPTAILRSRGLYEPVFAMNQMGKDGVYMQLLSACHVGQAILKRNFNSSIHIILAFSTSLLDRQDYYVNWKDQNGEIDDETFYPDTIDMYPSRESPVGNECVFREPVDMQCLQEIWVNSWEAKVAVSEILNLSVDVKFVTKFPAYPSIPLPYYDPAPIVGTAPYVSQ